MRNTVDFSALSACRRGLRAGAQLLAAGAVLSLATVEAGEPVRVRFVEVELVSEVQSIRAGEPFWLGLRLAMDPDWHSYWENPGDSGLATSISWELPAGFEAGELQWPYPQRFEHPPYVTYGYEDEVLLIAEIRPPATLTPGESLNLAARAAWTVCRGDLCTPGRADLSVDLAVKSEAPEVAGYWHGVFERTRERIPQASKTWQISARASDGAVIVELTSTQPGDPGRIRVFPRAQGQIDHAKAPIVTRDGDIIRIENARADGDAPETFDAVLVASNAWDEDGRIKALAVSVPVERR